MQHHTARTNRPFPWLLAALVVTLAFILAGNLAGLEFWPLSKLVHFPVYWGLFALGLGAISVARRRWLIMIATLAVAIGFGAQLTPLFTDPEATIQPADPASAITVMTFNVLKHNSRYAEVLGALQSAKPDVLYLTEMAPAWHEALAPLSAIYPHRVGLVGNMLLSKFPLSDARRVLVDFDAANAAFHSSGGAMQPMEESFRDHWWNTEVLTATVIVGNKRVRVVGIHPPIPGDATSVLIQRAVACISKNELQHDSAAQTKLMLGDFNNTRFSPTFRFILQHTRLRDSAMGLGYTPTWGPLLRDESLLPWVGIPIDHILASENAQILARDVGPFLGSDHRWVRATIRF